MLEQRVAERTAVIQKPVDFEQFRQTVKTVGLYWMVINQRPAANGTKKSVGVGGS